MAAAADQVQAEEVLYAVRDRVATITFNRAELQNTISGPMLEALSRYLLQANDDSEVRAIVITGSGRFFCAGLDLRGGGIASTGSSQNAGSSNLDLRNAPPTVLHMRARRASTPHHRRPGAPAGQRLAGEDRWFRAHQRRGRASPPSRWAAGAGDPPVGAVSPADAR